MKARLLVAGLVAVVASLVMAAGASASGKAAVVTTISDSPVLAPPNCSLRDAIVAVTNDAPAGGCAISSPGGDDKITFDPSLSGQTISLSLGPLDVDDPDDLLITGPGMNQLTVTAHDASRVFNLATGAHIIGMSLVHGNAPPTGGVAQGGAINSTASGIFSLFLTDVKVADSKAEATASTGTAFADGGAIHSQNGRLVLEQSVVTGNHATATGTGTATAEARGGAIFAEGGASITDSTISGNQATATTVGVAKDAQATSGIRSDDELDMSGSTVSGNIAATDAPGTGSNSTARGALFLNNGCLLYTSDAADDCEPV